MDPFEPDFFNKIHGGAPQFVEGHVKTCQPVAPGGGVTVVTADDGNILRNPDALPFKSLYAPDGDLVILAEKEFRQLFAPDKRSKSVVDVVVTAAVSQYVLFFKAETALFKNIDEFSARPPM